MRLRSLFTKRNLASLAGVVAAFLAFECALRPFVASANLFAGSTSEVRQFREGVSAAHFAQDGARLTGADPVDGAPYGLILGDSHVEAVQVRDGETMGAVVERRLRSEGVAFNVRQYGWSGGAAPTYVAMADELLREWHPTWVVVVLNTDDLGSEPLESARLWRMRVEPDLSVRLVDVRVTPPPASGIRLWLRNRGLTWSNLREEAVDHSSLLCALLSRYEEIAEGTPAPARTATGAPARVEDPQVAVVARASVRALKAAYGDRLVIVYTPIVGPETGDEPDYQELELEAACREEAVACVSTRAAMLDERDRNARLCRGFHNTVLGTGHLNVVGHEIVGEAIVSAIRGR